MVQMSEELTIRLAECIQQSHEGLSKAAHYPAVRTLEIVQQQFRLQPTDPPDTLKSSNLLPLILEYIAQCTLCQLNSNHHQRLAKQYRSLMSEDSFALVGIDLVGPMLEDAHGFKYIMHIKDHFDRFSCLFMLSSL